LASKSDRLSLDHDDSDASPSILSFVGRTNSLPKLELASGTQELPAPLLVPPTDTQELPAPLLVPLVCEQCVTFVDVPLLTDIRSSSLSPLCGRRPQSAGARIGIEGARLGVDHICGDTAKTMSSDNHRMFDMSAVHGLASIHASAGQYVATTSFIKFSKSSRSMWSGTRNMMGHQSSPPVEVEAPF